MNLLLKIKIIEMFRTQADFAQKIKAHEAVISRVIHGRRTLKPKEKRIWANALQCKVCDLFKR